ncbi:MAG: KamA family radical SAM protein [Proteobacteria bacterium]|nr:KamA family radical SAM protein [Pseudomonadota bacterium]
MKPPDYRNVQSDNQQTEQNEIDEPPSLINSLDQSVYSAKPVPGILPIRPAKRPPSRILRKQFIFRTTPGEWNNWQWQLKNRICNLETLSAILTLSDEERDAMESKSKVLPLSITPYYASLLDKTNPLHPLRRAVVPVRAEFCRSFGEKDDPLGEDADSPVPGIVHRYPDRVLFLVTGFCSTYCRYCTRSRMVGGTESLNYTAANWEKALNYIESNTSIRDVLLSGGDPLTLSDEALEWLLSRLCRIPHIEIIRIGTKAPVVLPQRITPKLVKMLKRYHPLWINVHFMHPEEITPETSLACTRLADAGIPLGSQTVLLKGINDDVDTMKNLFHMLLKIRVRPYYLYQCDPITGSGHFRTRVEKGLEIIKGLRGHTSGLALPNYVIDAPGGGGKIPLLPEYVMGRYGDNILLKNYEELIFSYPDTSLKRSYGEETSCL